MQPCSCCELCTPSGQCIDLKPFVDSLLLMHTYSNVIAYSNLVHHSTHRWKNQPFSVFIVHQVLFDNLDIHFKTMPFLRKLCMHKSFKLEYENKKIYEERRERMRERGKIIHIPWHCNVVAIGNDYLMITVENFLDYRRTFKVRKLKGSNIFWFHSNGRMVRQKPVLWWCIQSCFAYLLDHLRIV